MEEPRQYGSKRVFWHDESGNIQVTKQPIIRVDKEKQSFYNKLDVSKEIRNTIKLYNWIKKNM